MMKRIEEKECNQKYPLEEEAKAHRKRKRKE